MDNTLVPSASIITNYHIADAISLFNRLSFKCCKDYALLLSFATISTIFILLQSLLFIRYLAIQFPGYMYSWTCKRRSCLRFILDLQKIQQMKGILSASEDEECLCSWRGHLLNIIL